MARKPRKKRKQLEPLEAIKRLLMLVAAKQGATSEEVGRALETSASNLRSYIAFRQKRQKGD